MIIATQKPLVQTYETSRENNIKFGVYIILIVMNFMNTFPPAIYPGCEKECTYVCSRGLYKSCDLYSQVISSSTQKVAKINFANMKAGDVLYLCSSAIPEFRKKWLRLIPYPFVLVSGDCDETVPLDIFSSQTELDEFMDNPKLIHWYSQNCVTTGFSETHRGKVTQMPIGLDYHTMARTPFEQIRLSWGISKSPKSQEMELMAIQKTGKSWMERKCMAHANFHFMMETKYGSDRKLAKSQLPETCVFYEPQKATRDQTWKTQVEYAFVISPHGGGYDCHRTWEALCLGCIPIVKTSPLDAMFSGLPVWIVDEWTDVNLDTMIEKIAEFSKKWENGGKSLDGYEKLKLSYWVEKIRETRQRYLDSVADMV